ncbi:MAG: S8 family serine peptidase, partial [bacterium]|nr:S8 family serine peptidase [bacterium]
GLDNPAAEAHYGRNCIVALLDTGIDATHPDLMHCVLGGYNFVDDNGDTRDLHGHGTACAGIIAGNGLGAHSVKGIAPRAYVMAVKVMDASGRGTAFDVVEGPLYAVERGARVINLSMSAQGESEAVREAIAYAWQRGAVVVAAAGNEGRDEVAFPGSVGEVISVGAVDGLLQRAPFSNYGGKLTVVAPGVAVLTTAREKGYMEFSGTSAAAPFIAGALAALIGDRSGITAEEAYRAVTQAADNLGRGGRDAEFGYGIVNVRRLLADPRDRIYDVAMTTIYFDPPTLRLGTEAQVYFVIQNRGTRLIRNARVVTRVGGSRVEHTLGDLQPSQCVEVQRSLKLPESFGGQPVRVEGMVMLQEIDVAPYNNGRAVTLHPSVWRE